MVLHSLEDDDTPAGRLDLGGLDVEILADPQRLDLVLNQPLSRFLERLLDLAYADSPRAGMDQAVFNQALCEVVRLARPSPSMRALVSGFLQKRQEYAGGLNP